MRPMVKLKSPPDLPMAALRLHRSMAWPVGQAEMEFSLALTPPAAGDAVVIEGSSDGTETNPLFTGRVLRLQQGLWSIRLLAEEATGPLTRLYMDKAFPSGTAAGAISDLCDQASVEKDIESPGASLPSLVLLSNQSGLDHIMRLARMSGFATWTDVNGKLFVKKALESGSTKISPKKLSILDFREEADPDDPIGGSFSGDGGKGSQGDGAENWLIKDLSAVTKGDGKPTVHLAGLKVAADVEKAAKGEATRLQEAMSRRTLTLAGVPPADLGEIVELEEFKTGNGKARVVGIEVIWSADSGLFSRLDLHAIGG